MSSANASKRPRMAASSPGAMPPTAPSWWTGGRIHPHTIPQGKPDRVLLEDYPATVATTWRLNLDQVATRSPAAVQLLQVVSFLAPAAIPPDLFGADLKVLPVELAQAAA